MVLFNYASIIGVEGISFGLLAILTILMGNPHDAVYLILFSLYHIPIGWLVENLERRKLKNERPMC